LEDRGGSRVCMLAWVLSAEEGQAERDLDRYSRLTTPILLTIVQYRLCSPCWHACCPSKPFQPPTLSTPQHEHVSPVDTMIRKLNTPPTQHRVGEDLESLPELPRNSQIRRNATLRLAERLGNRRGTHATCDSDNVRAHMDCCHRYPLDIELPVSRCAFRDTALSSPMRRTSLICCEAWRSTEGHAACRVVHGREHVCTCSRYLCLRDEPLAHGMARR
jgi:hypothetical protein